METLALIWVITVLISFIIDIHFFVKREIENIAFGMFLIFCPILNIIYSMYIIIKYWNVDFEEFL